MNTYIKKQPFLWITFDELKKIWFNLKMLFKSKNMIILLFKKSISFNPDSNIIRIFEEAYLRGRIIESNFSNESQPY